MVVDDEVLVRTDPNHCGTCLGLGGGVVVVEIVFAVEAAVVVVSCHLCLVLWTF